MRRIFLIMLTSSALFAGCAANIPPIEPVESVDLERFMGDWYVIANIPTAIEKEAYNAVESYEHKGGGEVATTFTFRKGGFEGPKKTYTPTGFVKSESNAVWAMQFIWPIKADYRIIYLNDDYSQTVIGRNKRDYVWIMARTPAIPEADYELLVEFVDSVGYDIAGLQRVPQLW
jgi:apolipoprotein D and lipocalin family protein